MENRTSEAGLRELDKVFQARLELSRRDEEKEFWKACVISSLTGGKSDILAKTEADWLLSQYKERYR